MTETDRITDSEKLLHKIHRCADGAERLRLIEAYGAAQYEAGAASMRGTTMNGIKMLNDAVSFDGAAGSVDAVKLLAAKDFLELECKQAATDIRNLLSIIRGHESNVAEPLEEDDNAVVSDIETRWPSTPVAAPKEKP